LSSHTLGQIITRGRNLHCTERREARHVVWLLRFPSAMQLKLAARDMIRYCNRWDQQVINQIRWGTSYHTSPAEPNLPRPPFAQIYHELTGTPHRNRREKPLLTAGAARPALDRGGRGLTGCRPRRRGSAAGRR
jgi:hypothetical protein